MWGNTAVMHQGYNDLAIYLTWDGSYLFHGFPFALE